MGGILLHLLLEVPDEERALWRRLPAWVGNSKVDEGELRLAILSLLAHRGFGPALRQPLQRRGLFLCSPRGLRASAGEWPGGRQALEQT